MRERLKFEKCLPDFIGAPTRFGRVIFAFGGERIATKTPCHPSAALEPPVRGLVVQWFGCR